MLVLPFNHRLLQFTFLPKKIFRANAFRLKIESTRISFLTPAKVFRTNQKTRKYQRQDKASKWNKLNGDRFWNKILTWWIFKFGKRTKAWALIQNKMMEYQIENNKNQLPKIAKTIAAKSSEKVAKTTWISLKIPCQILAICSNNET